MHLEKRLLSVIPTVGLMVLCTAADRPDGIVIADGALLSPPYVFEGVGTDTLRLNGHVFDVVWHPDPIDIDALDPPTRVVYETRRSWAWTGGSLDELVGLVAARLSALSEVDSAWVAGSDIVMYRVPGIQNPVTVHLGTRETGPLESTTERHERRIRGFRTSIAQGVSKVLSRSGNRSYPLRMRDEVWSVYLRAKAGDLSRADLRKWKWASDVVPDAEMEGAPAN